MDRNVNPVWMIQVKFDGTGAAWVLYTDYTTKKLKLAHRALQ